MTRAGTRIIGVLAGAIAWAAADARLLACPICFQAEHTPVTEGIAAAVATLLGVAVVVLTACGVFFGRLLRATPAEPVEPEEPAAL
jgi:hypothetical protein